MTGRVRSASVAAGLALFRRRGLYEVKEIFARYDPKKGIYRTMRDTYPAVFTPQTAVVRDKGSEQKDSERAQKIGDDQ